MRQLIDHLVDEVPGVTGALVSSADGFVLASRLPSRDHIDPSAVAAMSAATIGLSNRLVRLTGESPSAVSHQRSTDGQVLVFSVAQVAVLTLLAAADADGLQLTQVGREVVLGLQRLFHNANADEAG
ncbi:MAG: roadblock/LC7 domain-containing protein [Ilumatobacter sp.]|uniref:roadblock/LC7 domain-containing protein n=1 Tax=Ilumatobacter sp. TaxID=1967498 RepID=UPI00261281A4|nr:roadblock/LC7 domain-containing protein [Ilumatobacter sp.]MDJ0771699.1 roadblock/LC7 domain-containing protein [Ilumatobacter sp.]